MDQDLIVFDAHDTCGRFEDFSRENGVTYWLESELASMLGYSNLNAIKKASQRAMSVCITAGIPVVENFIQVTVDGCPDVKMTRFACYLVVMNGDIGNRRVANAQAYFAALANEIVESAQIDRVYLRGEISEREKTLSHTANQHGVTNFALFRNAGYRGMYNMNMNDLKNIKNLPDPGKNTLLDFMNKDELAANIFRLSQTESRIRAQNIHGQKPLEAAAESVGKIVREAMITNTGIAPENLELDDSKIQQVKTGLKQANRAMKKLDKSK